LSGIVGIIFDDIQSLVLDCIFSDKQARAVSVNSVAITAAAEGLRREPHWRTS
jgi:hypothetical protein